MIERGGEDRGRGERFGWVVLTVGCYFELLDLAGGVDYDVHVDLTRLEDAAMRRRYVRMRDRKRVKRSS